MAFLQEKLDENCNYAISPETFTHEIMIDFDAIRAFAEKEITQEFYDYLREFCDRVDIYSEYHKLNIVIHPPRPIK